MAPNPHRATMDQRLGRLGRPVRGRRIQTEWPGPYARPRGNRDFIEYKHIALRPG
jgi:hypothetical protein